MNKTGNLRKGNKDALSLNQLLPWESNNYYLLWLYACSLRFNVCNAYAPYCKFICDLCGYTVVFPHYLIKDTFFRKMSLNIKHVFLFSLQVLSETFLTLRRIQRDITKNVHTLSYEVPVAYAPYCKFLCDFSGYTVVFPHYLIKDTFSRKMSLNIEYVFWFSLQVLSEIFLTLRRIQRDILKNVHTLSYEVPVILVTF